jgi:dethiobiotin synthetase
MVGTDTAVGKTQCSVAILRAARHRGLRVLPAKPASSAAPGELSDLARLLAAAPLPADLHALVGPFTYPRSLAPGVAHDLDDFLDRARTPDHAPLHLTRERLLLAEDRVRPQLTLLEGAGGLHVPMPGGTWQPTWIAALATHAVVVARLGLGTLNHTRLTVDALRTTCPDLRLAGVLLVDLPVPTPDASATTNAAILAAHLCVPVLGVLPRLPRLPRADPETSLDPAPAPWLDPGFWAALGL